MLSHFRLFATPWTPWTAARQASLSITNSRSLLKLMPIESVMPSNHLILCRPLLLLPSIFPSIRVFSNESVLRIRWSKYWSFICILLCLLYNVKKLRENYIWQKYIDFSYPAKASVSSNSENLFILKCIFSPNWIKVLNLITTWTVQNTETKHLIYKYTLRLNFHILKFHHKNILPISFYSFQLAFIFFPLF